MCSSGADVWWMPRRCSHLQSEQFPLTRQQLGWEYPCEFGHVGAFSASEAPAQKHKEGLGFRDFSGAKTLLKGSWDLVTRVTIRVTLLIAPIKVLIALFTKSHDPLSTLVL